jgi:uncharacterized repeat protein (TIGR01451 family)
MNPSLGLLLPLAFGQPVPTVPSAVLPASGLATRAHVRTAAFPSAAVGCGTCGTPAGAGVGAGRPVANFPQHPLYREPCPPVGPPAPVLAMRLLLPDGASVAVDPSGKGYGTGSLFGFRPGYVYRLKVTTAAGELGATLEVRGSIVPRPNMRYMEFPAALFVSPTDVQRAAGGGVVTKVLYLENPEKAIPVEELPNQPIEVAADTERDAVETAEANGRVVAVLRVGDRAPSRDELARAYVDGTVLLPGETKLGLPGVPPAFGCSAVPLYDPILGPKPLKEECFPNGGDGGPRVGIGPGGRLGGLDPTDAAAEWTRGDRREATVSNVVCLCSPRFVARRAEVAPGGLNATVAPLGAVQVVGRSVFRFRAYAEEFVGRERTLGLIARQRPAGLDTLVVLNAVIGTAHTQAVGMTEGVRQVSVVVQPDELTSFPARLTLTKSVDPPGPYQPGDVVTISLKFANNTRQPIRDLVISDSLSPRLEYVPGTAASDRPSNVTTADNEAGSSVIRFDIPGPIPPAATGVVVFKVKIR